MLDRNHLHFALFRRGQQTAVSCVLKVLGDLLRDYETGGIGGTWSYRQTMAALTVEAVEHALRWILTLCPKGTHKPGKDWEQKDAEAIQVIVWAINYARLYVDHTAWSRGLLTPLIDLDAKTIKFEAPAGGSQVLQKQWESDQLAGLETLQSMPPKIDEQLLDTWLQSCTKRDLVGLPDLPSIEGSAVYEGAVEWANQNIIPEIDGGRDLGGYTLADYRKFYARFWLYCNCVSLLEDQFDQLWGHENPLGSRLLQGRRGHVVYRLSQYCKMSQRKVGAIIDQLTFDGQQRHPSFPGHPFVATRDGALTMLVRLFARTDPSVMLSLALNSGHHRAIYEEIIGEIEEEANKRIATQMRQMGCQVWDDPVLRRPSDGVLTPDLVVSKEEDDWVCILEYKHALPPRGAAGVSNRVKEMSKWMCQAERYRDAARQQVGEIEARLGISVRNRKVFVAIVARWPMPIPFEISSDCVVLTDLPAVLRMASADTSVKNMFDDGLGVGFIKMAYQYHPIEVGEWTYQHPFLGTLDDLEA